MFRSRQKYPGIRTKNSSKKVEVNRPNFHRGSHSGPKEGAEGVFPLSRSVGDCPDPNGRKQLYSRQFSR